MDNYNVSIIVPCYNISGGKKYFDGTINSLVNQSYGFENIEVIFVDDCSTDDTRIILNDLSAEYENIKLVLLDENVGVAQARNQGMSVASGEYILFLDNDDKYNEKTVETLYETITDNDLDLVFSNYSLDMEDGRILDYHTGNDDVIITDKYHSGMKYIVKFFWTGIYNRNFLKKHNICFYSCSGEDSRFLAECICSTDKSIILLNNFHSVYYTPDNLESDSHNFLKDKLLSFVNTFDLILSNYVDNKVNNEFYLSQVKDFKLFLMGFVLRSNDNFENFNQMILSVRDFLLKYENVELRFHWILISKLMEYKGVHILYLLNKGINKIFYQKWFERLFRNDGYR